MLMTTHQYTHPRRLQPSSMLLGELQILQALFLYTIKIPGNKTAG
jgi:hypothetical protein